MAGHIARFEVHLRDPQIIASDEAEEDLGKEAPLLGREPAHDPEIDRREPTFAVDEEVSLMHVGVEEAVADGMAQEVLHHRSRQPAEIETALPEAFDVGKRGPCDPFAGEHPPGGQRPLDFG